MGKLRQQSPVCELCLQSQGLYLRHVALGDAAAERQSGLCLLGAAPIATSVNLEGSSVPPEPQQPWLKSPVSKLIAILLQAAAVSFLHGLCKSPLSHGSH